MFMSLFSSRIFFTLKFRRLLSVVAVMVLVPLLFVACSKKETPTNQNLLTNGSFDEGGGDIPKGWSIGTFRGLPDQKTSTHGIDTAEFFSPSSSFYFQADSDTRHFETLYQELEVKDIRRVRIRGMVKAVGMKRNPGQHAHVNFGLTYYDADHNRFSAARFADRRTRPFLRDTDGWEEQDQTFLVPDGTAYIVVHCLVGIEGTVWFDDVSLEIPDELDWEEDETENFTFYSRPEKRFPEGSMEFQQELYDYYSERLGVREEERENISYYYYPDTLSIRKALGIKSHMYVNWNRREIHSVNPVDNHEIVHLITHPYGTLPRALAEGTAYYFLNNFGGEAIQPMAQAMLKERQLPSLESIINPASAKQLGARKILPTAASFIGYLMTWGGPDRFLALHEHADEANDYAVFSAAFENVYGVNLVDAERSWWGVLARADFSRIDSTDVSP